MPSRKITRLLALTALAISFFLLGKGPLTTKKAPDSKQASHSSDDTPQVTRQPEAPLTIAETLRARTPSSKPNLDPRIARYTDGSADFIQAIKISGALHKSNSPHQDLAAVSQLLTHYRLFYQENPVGVENFEFTGSLTGNNPQKVNFIDPNSASLSSNNELVDRWGSPFIFHPLSATNMEIRSLGPDKTLWTEDDLTFGAK